MREKRNKRVSWDVPRITFLNGRVKRPHAQMVHMGRRAPDGSRKSSACITPQLHDEGSFKSDKYYAAHCIVPSGECVFYTLSVYPRNRPGGPSCLLRGGEASFKPIFITSLHSGNKSRGCVDTIIKLKFRTLYPPPPPKYILCVKNKKMLPM